METQSKREFLVKVASQSKDINDDKFRYLLNLYKIHSEARKSMKTLTELFHYLDVGDTLCMKLLRKNLQIAGFRRLSLYVEEYLFLTTNNNPPKVSKTMRILNALREGLTANNIEDLHFIIGMKAKFNKFENYLLSLISAKKMGKIDTTYLRNSLNTINYKHLAENVRKYFERQDKNLHFPSRDELKRLDLVRIGKEIDEEEFRYLCFLLHIPIGKMESFKRPMELFYYLDSQELRLEELKNGLQIIGRGYLFEELVYFRDEGNVISPYININTSLNIFDEIQNCLTKENILHLSFLAGSEKLTIDFSEYLIKLVEFEKLCHFDVIYLIQTLKAIKREDLSQIVSNIDHSEEGHDDFVIRESTEERERIRNNLSLLALSLTDDDAEKIALLHDLPSRLVEAISFPIQLIHYLYHNKTFLSAEIENTLKIINRNELLHYFK